MLESLFNKVVGLEAYNFIENRFRHTCLPVNIAKFLKNSFFYRKPPVVAYMSTRKTKEEESVDQKREKFFKCISSFFFFKFYFFRFSISFFVFISSDKLKNVSCRIY